MEPPSLSTELRNYCYGSPGHALAENSFKNRSIGLVGLIVSLKTIEMGVVLPQSGRGFNFRARYARNCTVGTPLQEILDPPVCVHHPLPFCLVYIPFTCVYLVIITIVLTTCQGVLVHAIIVLKQNSTSGDEVN